MRIRGTARLCLLATATALLLAAVPGVAWAARGGGIGKREGYADRAEWSLAAKGRVGVQAIPGATPLNGSASGWLNADGTDWKKIYSVYVPEGKKLLVTMVPTDAGVEEYMTALFPPSATNIEDPIVVSQYDPDVTSSVMSYSVPGGKGGTYYIAAAAMVGSGGYAIDCSIVDAEDDDFINGVTLPPSPFNGALNVASDGVDVFTFHLNAGQRITARVSGAGDTAFGIFVFGPGTDDAMADSSLVWGIPTDLGDYPKVITYTAPSNRGDDYHLAVGPFWGAGSYTVSYTIDKGSAKSNVTGVPVPASPIYGRLDPVADHDHVYRVHLTAGQTFAACLTGVPGTEFFPYLFSPKASDVCSDSAVGYQPSQPDEAPIYPKKFTYKVPVTGDYYLDLWAPGNLPAGNYTCGYLAATAAGFTNPIAYDLASGQKTWMKFRANQANVSALLQIKTASGPVTVYNGTLSNAANVDSFLPMWNGTAGGKRLPSASYDWTLTLSKNGASTTFSGKVLVSRIVFSVGGTSKGNVAVKQGAYMVTGSVNCYLSATTASGGSDSLNVSLSGPSGYFTKPKTSAGVAPPWTFGPGALNTAGYIRGTSAVKARGTHTWSMTGKTNVTYKMTVIQ